MVPETRDVKGAAVTPVAGVRSFATKRTLDTMRARFARGCVGAIAVLAMLGSYACSLSSNGEGTVGPDGSTTDTGGPAEDGATEASVVTDSSIVDAVTMDAQSVDSGPLQESGVLEAGPDCGAGFRCGNDCLPPGTDPCGACDAGHLACNDDQSCVSDCVQCTGRPVECCNAQGAPSGACLTFYLINTFYNGQCPTNQVRCPCASGDAGSCPSASQVCLQDGCNACGETPGTDGLTCHGSGTCSLEAGACL